jgi:hypothetical protein
MPRAVPSQVASVIDELSWNADCTGLPNIFRVGGVLSAIVHITNEVVHDLTPINRRSWTLGS